MKWTGLNDLREQFLSFFESKGHTRLPSASLVPKNDKSLLLINSGMAPLKKYFLGLETPPNHRVTTCQKCIRTPDIDSVGHDDRHGTYFEMLGNFSFGDYFKREAIAWSWEFLTSPEWVGLDPNRLYPSVFEGNETTPADDEAMAVRRLGFYARCGAVDTGWTEHLFDAWFRVLVLPAEGETLDAETANKELADCYSRVMGADKWRRYVQLYRPDGTEEKF